MKSNRNDDHSFTHPHFGLVLRTPDYRFENLVGFSYQPHYLEFEGLRIHYVDEGSITQPHTFLCIHGEPSWSYLFRKMIPHFVREGRVVCPDLIGFGRTDKIFEDKHYTFTLHRNMLKYLIEKLDLKNITLVCQDWGGLLGLTLPMDYPDRFKRLIVMNTGFGTGDIPLGKGFLEWREFVRKNPNFSVGALMKRSTPHLTDEEVRAYDAPYPNDRYKTGARMFPSLVPDNPNAEGADVSRRAREWWNEKWNGETFMAVGMKDPVLGPPAMMYLRQQIRNCPEPMLIEEAGHFVQEWGSEIAFKDLKRFNKQMAKL